MSLASVSVAATVSFPVIVSPAFATAPNAVKAAAAVVAPVPPFATFSVPASVIVPLVVTVGFVTVNPVVPADNVTLVTVPPPPLLAAGAHAVPFQARTWPEVGAVAKTFRP